MQNKEYLYVGHYIDENDNYILKIGTTNNIKTRTRQHNNYYKNKAAHNRMKPEEMFIMDWFLPLSKYNTTRFEDKNRDLWKEMGIGQFVNNDRFDCGQNPPKKVTITIRKTYEIALA